LEGGNGVIMRFLYNTVILAIIFKKMGWASHIAGINEEMSIEGFGGET